MSDEVQGRPVVTAAELDGMTAHQVDEAWRDSVVTDPEELPSDYVERLRQRARERLSRRETPAAS